MQHRTSQFEILRLDDNVCIIIHRPTEAFIDYYYAQADAVRRMNYYETAIQKEGFITSVTGKKHYLTGD